MRAVSSKDEDLRRMGSGALSKRGVCEDTRVFGDAGGVGSTGGKSRYEGLWVVVASLEPTLTVS